MSIFIYICHHRTIFRWITVKNLNTMQFDDTVRTDTPMGLLRGIKHGTESYHVLFKRICRYYRAALLPAHFIQAANLFLSYKTKNKQTNKQKNEFY